MSVFKKTGERFLARLFKHKEIDELSEELAHNYADEMQQNLLSENAETSFKSRGDFCRYSALNVMNVEEDFEDIKQIARYISSISNSFNQIAFRINKGGKFYDEDIAAMKARLEEIWQLLVIVFQKNFFQLKRLYEKSWEELPGNCDTMIYLGGKDQFTNEYLSKELGKETIDQQSINQTKGKQGSSSYNNAILGRELATIDELSTMDNNDCIVMVRGLHPFMTAKFDIINHPRYNMLDEADKHKNTYYLENNIRTMPETEYVDFSGMYDSGKVDPDNFIEIGYVTSDNEIIKSAADLMEDIPQNIREMLSDIDGVYAA